MVKFLDEERLIDINTELKSFNRGDLVLHSRVELYSMKDTNKDKKLRKVLLPEIRRDAQQTESSSSSSSSSTSLSSGSNSPLLESSKIDNNSNISLQETKGERLLLDFIRTLNLYYSQHDYDFSYARPRHFTKKRPEAILEDLDHAFSHHLVLGRTWKQISNVIKVEDDCIVYQFYPDPEPDALVHFCYLFYSKSQKQIVVFAGHGHSTVHSHDSGDHGIYHEFKSDSQYARSPFKQHGSDESDDSESESDELEEHTQDDLNLAPSQGYVDVEVINKIEEESVPNAIVTDVPRTNQFSSFAFTRTPDGQLIVTPSPNLCPTASPMHNMLQTSPELRHSHSGSNTSLGGRNNNELTDFSL